MVAEFFYKKIGWIARGVCVAVTFLCMGYAFMLSQVKSVSFHESMYFLVTEDTKVEAGAEFIKWEGGAGYLLENGGEEYVVVSVFSERESAETVQNRLTESGKKTSILNRGAGNLYFKGREKKKAKVYVSGLKLLKSYILLLEDCIGKLENGMTQQACKRILQTLKKQFDHAQNIYAEYASFCKVCEISAQELEDICEGTVYLKDLRYLLCYQADCFTQLCAQFSL